MTRIPPTPAELLSGSSALWIDAFRRCRKAPTKKAIHAVRVLGRRLLSVLELMDAVRPDRKTASAAGAVKEVVRGLSRIRDVQVQQGWVARFGKDRPAAEALLRRLEEKEGKGLRRLRGEIDEVRAGRLERRLRKIRRRLEGASTEPVPSAVEAACLKVDALRRLVDPADRETLHRMRVALKRYRYMVEAALKLLPEPGAKKLLRDLKAAQDRLGVVQDLDVLLQLIGKFASKRPDLNGALADLAVEVARRQTLLIRKYLAATGTRETPRPAFLRPEAQAAE
jgi:CHAD domain-containing protein